MTANVSPDGGQLCPTPVGLYVHIPFCSGKCFYCDFASFAGQKSAARRYLRALEAEARLAGPRAPETLYIGGGTPSELDFEELEELFALIRRAYTRSLFREITVEANPESLDADKLSLLAREGMTRLSLGLQSANAAELASIGRRHAPEDFFRSYREARALGGFAISVDLMYGLPGQTLASCLESLDSVLELEPEHLSLYGLQVEAGTPLAKRGVKPDEDLCREMFEACLERIKDAGLAHYEISNFARPGFESLHNMIYWRDGEYVGLGCGAASHLGGERSSNIGRLIPYCEAVEKGRRPVESAERLEGWAKLGEGVFLGLRLIGGFAPTAEAEAVFAPQWGRLLKRGLIEREGPRVRLTREGLFLANQAFSEFVAPFEEVPA